MGGAERVLSTLSFYFANHFDRVIYLTWREAPIAYEIDKRVKILSIPVISGKSNFIGKALWLRKYIKKEKPSLVLSFLSLFNMMTLLSLLGLKQKVVVAERNDPKFIKGGKPIEILRNVLYAKSSGILCQTIPIQNYFKGSLATKTYVIYNPLFIRDDMKGISIQSTKEKRIVTVGRLHPQKNHKLMIETFNKFLTKNPEYTLTIYGEGVERENLERLIQELGLNEKVLLPGNSKYVHDEIKNAEIFLLTSRYEGMPNALIEAMAMGIPCISTKVSGATDLIKSGVNGILCESDADSICEAMCQIVEDKVLAKDISQNSVQIADLLDQDRIANQWIEYLKSTI